MSDGAAPKKVSLAFGTKRQKPKPVNGTKRPHAALHDSDEEESSSSLHQTISHFDQAAGGAIDINNVSAKKGPLVIPALPNRDRLEEGRRKRQKSGLPVESKHEVPVVMPTKPTTFGLIIPEKPSDSAADSPKSEPKGATNGYAATPPKERTEDELALDALLGNKPVTNRTIPISEEEAFHRDYDEAPEAPTLDQYMAVPVDEYGAALLRGMGWKDGDTLQRDGTQPLLQPKPFERRPALLGIGAKPAAAVGVELGEWGKAARGGRNAKQELYNPVVLRNKVTGETLTEEELKNKLNDQTRKEMELILEEKGKPRSSGKSSNPTKYGDDRTNKDRDRRRDRDGDYEHYKEKTHRDRSTSRVRNRDDGDEKRRDRRRQDDDGKNGEEDRRRRRERSHSVDSRDRRKREERSHREKHRSRRDDDRYDQDRNSDRRQR